VISFEIMLHGWNRKEVSVKFLFLIVTNWSLHRPTLNTFTTICNHNCYCECIFLCQFPCSV